MNVVQLITTAAPLFCYLIYFTYQNNNQTICSYYLLRFENNIIFAEKQDMRTLNQDQFRIIEDALLSAIYYIGDSAEAICDSDYLVETDLVLNELNNALELLRAK